MGNMGKRIVAAWALALLLIPGCGGSNADDFVGTYDVNVALTVTLLGVSMPQQTMETLTINEGTTTDLVIMRETCPLGANITDGSRFEIPSFSCDITVSSASATASGMGTGSVNNGQLTLTLDGMVTVAVLGTIPFTLTATGPRR